MKPRLGTTGSVDSSFPYRTAVCSSFRRSVTSVALVWFERCPCLLTTGQRLQPGVRQRALQSNIYPAKERLTPSPGAVTSARRRGRANTLLHRRSPREAVLVFWPFLVIRILKTDVQNSFFHCQWGFLFHEVSYFFPLEQNTRNALPRCDHRGGTFPRAARSSTRSSWLRVSRRFFRASNDINQRY